ncbi:MAG: hypothetical protein SWJ54_01475 [Cyanobacteriota bacterium]|nr:hypothetical protein [Cyanobacteriota bacterium]
MKLTSLKPVLWLTTLVGFSGLLAIAQPAFGQTDPALLFVQRTSPKQQTSSPDSVSPELQNALEQVKQAMEQIRAKNFAQARLYSNKLFLPIKKH